MGEEITGSAFSEPDFVAFQHILKDQTHLLEQWLTQAQFSSEPAQCGFELEAWLVDKDCQPACRNLEFIEALGDPEVTLELANFNIEFNYTPQALAGKGLRLIHEEMENRWKSAQQKASEMDMQIVTIGILPTVRDKDLIPANISGLHRYHALNEQVLKLRNGRPLQLDIHGKEILRVTQQDVMLESATTSFQIHFQVPLAAARRVYNASIIASAPMVALSANSPFLFGRNLWQETRIPLFEQAVEVGGYEEGAHGPMRRVTFGSGYVHESLFECFQENLDHYPVLLPVTLENEQDIFRYVRLHNGTLWRWNRPLIGQIGDQYHIRIEHRVVPAGPSIVDSVANAAMYYGLVQALSQHDTAPEHELPFAIARDNFYDAAKKGLESHLTWLDGDKSGAQSLILRKLIPLAWEGLTQLNVDTQSIKHYLGIIEKRVQNRCNGAAWQEAFVSKYGNNMQALTKAYLERQNSGQPVHEWGL